MSKKQKLFGTKITNVTIDEFPILDLSVPWRCRQCQQEQRGGIAYQDGLKVVCVKCAVANGLVTPEGSADGQSWHTVPLEENEQPEAQNYPFRYVKVKFNTQKTLQDAPKTGADKNNASMQPKRPRAQHGANLLHEVAMFWGNGEDKMIYDWEKIPWWLNWAIKDKSGRVYGFVNKPNGFHEPLGLGVLWWYDHIGIHGDEQYEILSNDAVLRDVPHLESLEWRGTACVK